MKMGEANIPPGWAVKMKLVVRVLTSTSLGAHYGVGTPKGANGEDEDK